MKEIKDLPNGIQGFISALRQDNPDYNDTVPAHYGVPDNTFSQWTKDIMCDIIQSNDKTSVIDKHFPKLSTEDRARVLAYNLANSKLKKVESLP